MTLQDVLQKVRFEDLVKPLLEKDSHTQSYLYRLKQAFDLLKMMEPEESDGEVISVSREYHKYDNEWYFSARYHARNDWEIMISREVEVEDNCNISDADLAAILLLEITFWGFSPSQESENLNEKLGNIHMEGNPYVAPYKKLEQRNHDLNCRYLEDIGTEYFTWKKSFDEELWWKPKWNGPKRHRQRRQEKRLEFVESKMKRWDLAKKLISKTNLKGAEAVQLQQMIMEGNSIEHHIFESRTFEGKEISYITDLIGDYFPSKEGAGVVVILSGPQRIIMDPQIDKVVDTLCDLSKIPSNLQQIRWVNDASRELRVDILIFK